MQNFDISLPVLLGFLVRGSDGVYSGSGFTNGGAPLASADLVPGQLPGTDRRQDGRDDRLALVTVTKVAVTPAAEPGVVCLAAELLPISRRRMTPALLQSLQLPGQGGPTPHVVLGVPAVTIHPGWNRSWKILLPLSESEEEGKSLTDLLPDLLILLVLVHSIFRDDLNLGSGLRKKITTT